MVARLILKSSSLDIEGNPTSSSDAFLVDMNKVFEGVVGVGLKKLLEATGLRVSSSTQTTWTTPLC
jgi:hypothetical protein